MIPSHIKPEPTYVNIICTVLFLSHDLIPWTLDSCWDLNPRKLIYTNILITVCFSVNILFQKNVSRSSIKVQNEWKLKLNLERLLGTGSYKTWQQLCLSTSVSMISVLLLSEDSTINYVVVDYISPNFDPLLTSDGQLWTFYKPSNMPNLC